MSINRRVLSKKLRKRFVCFLCAVVLIHTNGYYYQFAKATTLQETTIAPTTEQTENDVPSIYLSSGTEEDAVPLDTLTKADGYTNGNVTIQDKDSTILLEQSDLSIKVRGNTTAKAEKKPFTIKFPEKQNLFGMGKAKKYCLLANAYDPTLMRNYIALKLAKELELAYTSDFTFVDVYLDGEYWGNYLLVEPVEAGSSRVDLNTNKGEFLIEHELNRIDVIEPNRNVDTSNYSYRDLTELDDGITQSSAGTTYIELDDNSNYRFILSDPEYETQEETKQAALRAKRILQNAKDTLTNPDATMADLSKVIDVKSFARLYLLNEYLKLVDVGYSSLFFYYKNGKLYAGPAWDFDLSMGNAGAYYTRKGSNTFDDYNNCMIEWYDPQYFSSTSGIWANSCFFWPLVKNSSFMIAVANLYQQKKTTLQNIYEDNGWIDSFCREYTGTFAKNYTKWKVRDEKNSGTKENGYSGLCGMRYADETLEENVAYMKKWLQYRDEWLSGEKGWNIASIAADHTQLYEQIYRATDLNGNLYSNFDIVTKALQDAAEVDKNGTDTETLAATTKALKEAIEALTQRQLLPIADYNFAGGTAGEKIVDNKQDNSYTSVISGTNSKFTGHVTGDRYRSLKWSDEDYLDGDQNTIVPILEPKQEVNDGKWGANGEVYFQLETSTRQYHNLMFSASIGATKKGACYYKLQYSLDGTTFSDIIGSETGLSKNKTLEPLYQDYSLPRTLDNQRKLYIRIIVNSDRTVSGDSGFFGGTSGEIAINHIKLTATEKKLDYTEYDTASSAAIQLNPDHYEDFSTLQTLLEVDAYRENITQEEIDDLTIQLQQALDTLVKKPIFLVNYETNGGNAIETQEYIYGSNFSYAIPTNPGHEFDCWCEDEALTIPYDTANPPVSDVTLYAKWKVPVTFIPTTEPVRTTTGPTIKPSLKPLQEPTEHPTVKPVIHPQETAAPMHTPAVIPTDPPTPATPAPSGTGTPGIAVTRIPEVTAPTSPIADMTTVPATTVSHVPELPEESTRPLTTPATKPSPATEVPETTAKANETPVATSTMNAATAAPSGFPRPTTDPCNETLIKNDPIVLTLTATYRIPIAKNTARKIQTVDPSEITLYTEGLNTAKLGITYANQLNPDNVIWSSSEPKVATISDTGTVTAKSSGVTILTAKTEYGVTSVKLTVKRAFLKIANKHKLTQLKRANKGKIRVTASPKGKVTFHSRNKRVVVIDKNGRIHARQTGIAHIIVTCNHMKRKIRIKVI